MVLETPVSIVQKDEINELSLQHHRELFNLVNKVQPGYFKAKTALLGKYYGIFKENKLVAVCGERMKMNGFTEVSAIVTLPDYTGKGYAKQLIQHCCSNIKNENSTPFLHVTETNMGAISLYKKMGFETRRKISFWNYEVTVQ